MLVLICITLVATLCSILARRLDQTLDKQGIKNTLSMLHDSLHASDYTTGTSGVMVKPQSHRARALYDDDDDDDDDDDVGSVMSSSPLQRFSSMAPGVQRRHTLSVKQKRMSYSDAEHVTCRSAFNWMTKRTIASMVILLRKHSWFSIYGRNPASTFITIIHTSSHFYSPLDVFLWNRLAILVRMQ